MKVRSTIKHMQVALRPGTYVVAVSGGIDSMALLHVLRSRPGLKLIVAHFDHGIRPDSDVDRVFVEHIAKSHALPFIFEKGNLGPKASEATARTARYNFLESVKQASGARAIITAHHQDDLLETALLNLLRGTGRKGLTSLKSTENVIRPLLIYPKSRIKEYVATHKLAWREDETNQYLQYRRNYLRQNIMTKLTPSQRAQFQILLDDLMAINQSIDTEIINLLHTQPATDILDRSWFIALPHDISQEVLHYWLSHHQVPNLNRRRVEQLVTVIKTGQPKTVHDVSKEHKIHLSKKMAHMKRTVADR